MVEMSSPGTGGFAQEGRIGDASSEWIRGFVLGPPSGSVGVGVWSGCTITTRRLGTCNVDPSALLAVRATASRHIQLWVDFQATRPIGGMASAFFD